MRVKAIDNVPNNSQSSISAQRSSDGHPLSSTEAETVGSEKVTPGIFGQKIWRQY